MAIASDCFWSPCDYCLTASASANEAALTDLAATVYGRVCRTAFAAPGFALIDLDVDATSSRLRHFMVALKRRLHSLHRSTSGCDLAFLSAGRFDQQVTTKLHRDGGPDECFLMLGYEPSPVRAVVLLADYAKCAFDMGLTPQAFLDQHNPMFHRCEELLWPYCTEVACFSNERYQILLINNSIAPYGSGWQGLLHRASIDNPSDGQRRVINSTMIASVAQGTPEPISAGEQHAFVDTKLVRRAGYDKPHLEDDA